MGRRIKYPKTQRPKTWAQPFPFWDNRPNLATVSRRSDESNVGVGGEMTVARLILSRFEAHSAVARSWLRSCLLARADARQESEK